MTEEEKGFTIKDRRMFSEGEGTETEKDDKEVKGESPAPESSEKQDTPEKAAEAAADAAAADAPLPEVNFPTFVLSLNASALVHLGAIEDPASGKQVKNLPMAKQTIDILSMLEEKTRGNLNREEENILKNILYDLRIMFVKEKR
jgi:3-oxoacyl-ACP reductase-like protein